MELLRFRIFNSGHQIEDEYVNINPEHVVSVYEKEIRPSRGFNQKAAIIELITGKSYTIYDECRNVCEKIKKAANKK